ncbi:MAG: hypothetical protein KME45_26110 [Stenomitos rutilans HA7619-LM2]|jgi:hypothetical protein|nr:hypothetical protein [Stenomitos rutilans HA7619-LM2]
MNYQRSGTSGKRSQKTYLTNPKAIAHIARKVDEAITIASQTGAVNSFEDLKDLVEGHSQATSKHPIGMELCEIDGAMRGFRFYLQADPGKTISGKHLAIKAGAETYDYTPSTLAEHLGFDSQTEADFEEVIETELEFNDEFGDLDLANDLDTSMNLDDLDDDLAFAPQQRPQRNLQRNPQAAQDKRQASSKPAKPQKGDRYGYRQHPMEKVADSARQTANIGSELNGLNESGLITQLATLGVAISGLGLQQLADILEEAKRKGQEQRLQAILEALQHQNERVHDLGERLTELRSPVQPSTNDKANEEEVLSSVTNQVGDRIHRLGHDLDPDHKPLPPLKLNPEADINQKLDQLERYLNQMVKAIDGLEQRLETLEATVYAPQSSVQSEPKVEAEAWRAATQTSANHQAPVKAASLEQRAVAESLVELAALNHPVGTEADSQMIDVGEQLLFVEKAGEILAINLEANDGNRLFAASYQDGAWTVQTPLPEDECATLLKQVQALSHDRTRTEPEVRLAKQFRLNR